MRASSPRRSGTGSTTSEPLPRMDAAQFRRYGGPEVLEVVEIPRPQPGLDEVLVAVDACAVNPHDEVVRSGGLKMVTGRKMPLGIGLDFAGTVIASGADTTMAGTAVWGMVSPKAGHRSGAAAQYVVVPANRVSAKPVRLSMVESAALVTSGTTALRALRDVGQLKPGQRLLIRGAAGGVGMIAVQIGRALGAEVTALASARDVEQLAGLGAHQVLDHRAVIPRQLDHFDVILDTVGTNLLSYRRHLARGGRMVTIAFGSGAAMTTIAISTVFGSKRIRTFSSYPDRRLLEDLATLVESGAVWPVVDDVYPLRHIAEAHRALTRPGRRGKLVLTTASEPSTDVGETTR